MEITQGELEGLLIIKPNVFSDNRGYFLETFQQEKFNNAAGKAIHFVQDNESMSQKDVLRGLHFQNPPFAQGKLVRVIQGAVLDVAVDIRKNSKTFGQHQTMLLSAENKLQFYVPEGFAHGFCTLENNTIFSYKCTNYYKPEAEECLLWNDVDLGINWKINNPQLSEKDKLGKSFNTFTSQF